MGIGPLDDQGEDVLIISRILVGTVGTSSGRKAVCAGEPRSVVTLQPCLHEA